MSAIVVSTPDMGEWTVHRLSNGRWQITSVDVLDYGFSMTLGQIRNSQSDMLDAIARAITCESCTFGSITTRLYRLTGDCDFAQAGDRRRLCHACADGDRELLNEIVRGA